MFEIKIVKPKEVIKIGVNDIGFSFGFALFETIKVVDGKLFFWSSHWNRLIRSADFFSIGLDIKFQEKKVLSAIKSLASYMKEKKSFVLKLSLVPVEEGIILYVYSRDFLDYNPKVRLYLEENLMVNNNSILSSHKTHNYLENIYLLNNAKKSGYDDCLRLDTKLNISETCITNFFFIKGREIFTPSLDCGIFPGIIRSKLLENFKIKEVEVTASVLYSIDAAFLTNSVVDILPVYSIDLPFNNIVILKSENNQLIKKLRKRILELSQSDVINLLG